MKANLIQYIFAYGIPGKFCYAFFPIATLILSFYECEIKLSNLQELRLLALSLTITAVSIPLGILVSALFICIFLSPFYLAIERMNGGPFKNGDKVFVLAGRHKGKITEVYSDWQGLTVRIKLGKEENINYKDVYPTTRLIRIEEAEPVAGGDVY